MRRPSAGAERSSLLLALALIVAGAGAGSVACDKPAPTATSDASASRVEAAHGDASVASSGSGGGPRPELRPGEPPRPAPAIPPPSGPPCRIMTAENGPPMTSDATQWLTTTTPGNFSVKVFETGRELRFEGPGRTKACGGDVALVAAGSAVGLPGAGEAPGSEQWVATACGVGRWAAGVHRFSALGAKDGCRWQSSVGSANLYHAADVVESEVPFEAPDAGTPAPGASSPPSLPSVPSSLPSVPSSLPSVPSPSSLTAHTSPWRRVDGRRAFKLTPRSALDQTPAVRSAIAECERAAAAVDALAARMADGGAPSTGDSGTSVGDAAAASVAARAIARAACAVATVRVALGATRPRADAAADEARLEAAVARWNGSTSAARHP